MPSHHTYNGFDRPDILVQVGDQWWPGELRSWDQADDGTWTAQVQYRRDGLQHIDRVSADRVRPDEGSRGGEWYNR